MANLTDGPPKPSWGVIINDWMRTSLYLMRLMMTVVMLSIVMAHGCEDDHDPLEHGKPSGHDDKRPDLLEDRLPLKLARVDAQRLRSMIDQADREDQILVLDFWATWCAPCMEMLPALHEQVGALGPKVRLVSVTLDAPGELEDRAIRFLSDHQALDDAYMLVPDGDQRMEVVRLLGRRWRDLAVPAILIYSSDGELAEEYLSGAQGVKPIVAKLEKMLTSTADAAAH